MSAPELLQFNNAVDTRTATVLVDEDQQSLAIGKKGQNVRLASRLTDWIIEVRGERERKEAAEREMQGVFVIHL